MPGIRTLCAALLYLAAVAVVIASSSTASPSPINQTKELVLSSTAGHHHHTIGITGADNGGGLGSRLTRDLYIPIFVDSQGRPLRRHRLMSRKERQRRRHNPLCYFNILPTAGC